MVDAAGSQINDGLEDVLSYYHRCWSVIGILTLNGAVEKASQVLHKASCNPATVTPTRAPTNSFTLCISHQDPDCHRRMLFKQLQELYSRQFRYRQ